MSCLRYIILLLTVSLLHTASFSQSAPKNIDEIVIYLSKKIPKDMQEEIRTSESFDTVMYTIPLRMGDAYPIRQWTKNNRGKQKHPVIEYFNALGIQDNAHIELIILNAFRDYLNKKPLNYETLVSSYRDLEKRRAEEEKVRFTTDTLEGEYIPKDLEDCFRQIDKWWSDSVKQEVKSWTEDKFVNTTHHGFGTGLRNGWELWAGSRLSKYFNDMGITNPDDMSGIILTSYHRYLTGKELDVAGQIETYKQYWQIVRQPPRKDYPPEAKDIEFDMGMYYKGPRHGEGYLHIARLPASKGVWLYDYHFGWKKITKQQLDSLLKTKKSTMEEALTELFK